MQKAKLGLGQLYHSFDRHNKNNHNNNRKCKGNEGSDNKKFKYRSVRQRSWGKWVAEIRELQGPAQPPAF
ncbi:hypothetical protein ACFX2B_025187 [Malus domestica]